MPKALAQECMHHGSSSGKELALSEQAKSLGKREYFNSFAVEEADCKINRLAHNLPGSSQMWW